MTAWRQYCWRCAGKARAGGGHWPGLPGRVNREGKLSRLLLESVRYLDRGPIDLKLDPGESVAISGPSGAGKSLLLRAVADLIPWEGRIYLDGEECSDVMAPLWRRRVGLLLAESQWWDDTVGEHLGEGADAMLAPLGFDPEVRDWEIRRLSTGEKQRLALVRLLANGPAALLLDEPTASLDRVNVEIAESIISRYCREHGAPALWVSHDAEQARRLCTRGYRFNNGRLEQEF